MRAASMVHTLRFTNCPACHLTDKYLRSYLMIRHMYSTVWEIAASVCIALANASWESGGVSNDMRETAFK